MKKIQQRFAVRYAGVTKLNSCNHGDTYGWLRLRICYFGELICYFGELIDLFSPTYLP